MAVHVTAHIKGHRNASNRGGRFILVARGKSWAVSGYLRLLYDGTKCPYRDT